MTTGDVQPTDQPAIESGETVEIVLGASTAFKRSLLETILGDVLDVVGVASTGVEALSLIDEHDPDVAVLSTDLPIKDGVEAATEAKATNPDLGVVLLCGRTDLTPELLAEGAVDEFLAYPYQKPALIRAITGLVGSAASRAPG